MPTYYWEAKTRTGEARKGNMDAENEEAVHTRLKLQGLTPVLVKRPLKNIEIQFGTGVKTQDVVIFTRMFATMIDAGLPIVQGLDLLSQQTENKRFAKVLASIKSHVEEGLTLSDALSKHPKIFDQLFINLVAAGEAGGILDTILQRLSVYLEKNAKLKRRVKGAMTYPLATIAIAAVVVTILLTKVIPVFEKMFKEMGGGKLPAPTQVVINISHALAQNLPYILGALVVMVVGFKLFTGTAKGRELFDGFLLKIPVLGPVLQKITVARFTRTMGTLLSSGVPILDAMEIVAKTAGNTVVQKGIMYARDRVAEGKDIASPLAETELMPPMVVQMIAVGEQTGALDNMLNKIADFYEEEVDVAVASMTSLIEPFMMVFLGTVIGGMIIAMYMPIFEMAGNIKDH